MEVIRGSFLYRFVESIRRWYKGSVIFLFFATLDRSLPFSGIGRLWDRVFGCSMSTTENSRYNRILGSLNSGLARLGRNWRPTVEKSVPYRFWHSGFVRKSLLYKVVFSPGMGRIYVFLFAIYLPIDYALRRYSPVAALASGWDEAFLIFGILYVLFTRMSAERTMKTRANPLDLPILVFMAVGFLLLCVVSPRMGVAIAGYRAVVQYMVFFFVLTRVMKADADVWVFCLPLVAIGLFVSLHGIYQYIVAAPIPSGWVTQTEVGVRTRVFSIFGSPNIMGAFIVMVAPVAAACAYAVEKMWQKVLFIGVTGLMCLTCVVTFSRGAWLGLVVAIIVFALFQDRRLLALVFGAAGIAVFIPEVANRITFLFTPEFAEANQFGGRAGRRRDGMMLLNSVNQFFGYGLGRFGGAVAMQNQTDLSIVYFYMDNYYLKTLIEMGYLGVGAYLALLAIVLFTGIRAVYRTRGTALSKLAVGLLSGMSGVLVHSLTENIFEVPYMNALFWGMAAVLVFIGFFSSAAKANQSGAKK